MFHSIDCEMDRCIRPGLINQGTGLITGGSSSLFGWLVAMAGAGLF
jgi:hypothetical protein